MTTRNTFASALCLSTLIASLAAGQVAQPQAQITQAVEESSMVTLVGNVHPLTTQASAVAQADPATAMEHMVLQLQGSAAQEAALEQLIAQQSNPASVNYHKYLTPQAFAAQFGATSADIATVSAWLQSHGFTVEQVPAGNRAIVFSGNAAQVNSAFKTEMNQYTVNGVQYLANSTNPQIPAAFAGTVGGVLKLHNFQYQANIVKSTVQQALQGPAPSFAPSGMRMLVPADYYTLYDINPLLSAGIDGTGQSIAVLARSNIYLSDIQSFRTLTGLKSNTPKVIVTNSDPGIAGDDNIETTLDTEWAGAVAPGASIKVIVSSTTSSADGIDLSAIYAVSNNVAPIITLSYGACESSMGTTELSFYNALWKQASAQGQTVLVASGDSGAAGCASSSGATATGGKAVNGLCSSPYATCVGGTELVEGTNPGQYWLPSSPGSTLGSAIGYIPESVWNESGTVSGNAGVWAGGGGASSVYTKPTWQTGVGVPADGKRDVPDVSLTAASHDGYTVVQGGMIGYIFSVGGTSAATPSFAGMMALVNQKNNSAQGNINPILYPLAAKQAAGGAAIFHDITSGNNSVPGVTGYAATTGYDPASGLGSVDANLMVNLWNYASTQAPPLEIYANAVSVNVGQTASTTVTTVTTNLKSAVALAVSGVPTGVTATFSSTSIASPGSGSVTLKLITTSAAVPGVYSVKLTGTAGAQTATSTFALTITVPTFTLSYGGGLYPSVNFGPGAPYTPQQINLQTLPANGFNSPITLAATGLASGLTVTFSPATLAGGAVGKSVATVSAASTIKGGQYFFNITATGGGVTQTVQYSAFVYVQPSCALTPSVASIAFNAGASATIPFTCVASKANSNVVSITVAGMPGGATNKFSASTITAGGTVSLNLTSLSTAPAGTWPLTITGTEPDGATQMVNVFVALSTPVFSLSLNPTAVTGVVGTTTQVTGVITPDKGFNTPVTVWIGPRPTGVQATFTSSNTISLAIGPTAVPGTYPLTIGGIANTGFSRTVTSTFTIVAAPTCSLASSASPLSLSPGKSATAQVTCSVTKGTFIAPLSLSVSGAPNGVTSQFSSSSLTAGSSTTLTLNAASTVGTGSSMLSLTATGSGYTQTISIPLSIVQPSFAISTSSSAATVKTGSTTQVSVSSKIVGSFNSAVALSATGLPAGVTASFSTASVAAPGNGTVTMTLTASSSAKTGTYTIGSLGTGGGLTSTGAITLTVSH